MYYKTCPKCGAHLDPGERCDCEENNNDKTTVRPLPKTDQRPKKKLYILGREVWCSPD